MNYGQQRGFDRAPAPTIEVNDIKFGTEMPDQLFADIAQDKAKTIFEAGAGRKNKSTQLRKFYDELVMWQDKVAFEQGNEARAGKYKELAPFIKMLNAKVAYARGRDHVDLCFEKLFSHVIRQITDPDTLKHAKLFMEAFMGFYKAEEK
jgi:CRISPR-associated protein Csm2